MTEEAHPTATFLQVQTPDVLEAAAARWRQAGALALDLEFVRTRTFYPKLGLIQVADGHQQYLVDPLAIENLSPLWEVLRDEKIVKVLHSSREDLESIFYRFGDLPRNVFDTQVAAAFLGFGYAIGYQALVRMLLAVELPKNETRTNWTKRPLTAAQLMYAALDVAKLLPMREIVIRRLEDCGRLSWVMEECGKLAELARFDEGPELYYRRIKSANKYDRHELAVLRALCAWRETRARERDLPRNFVLEEAHLLKLARARPQSLEELAKLEDIPEPVRRRIGPAAVETIAKAWALPEAQWPPAIDRPLNAKRYDRILETLKALVQAKATEMNLPQPLLAQNRLLEEVVRSAENDTPLPEELMGWRREVIGEQLRTKAKQMLAEHVLRTTRKLRPLRSSRRSSHRDPAP